MKKRQRYTSYLIVLILLVSLMSLLTGCATTTEEIPIPTVKSDVYIYDEDNIIDDNVENMLNKMLVELEQKTGAEFAVISVTSLLDNTIEDYANNLFNTLGIGKKGEDNGLLLLFSRSDNRVRLEVGRGLEGCLNDAKCGRILDNYFVPYRESDEYSKATELTVKAALTVICEEYNITISGLDIEAFETEETDDSNGIGIVTIILIIIGLIILEWVTGHIFGDGFGDGLVIAILSSGSGSSGGGFGGGCSGGGGASR